VLGPGGELAAGPRVGRGDRIVVILGNQVELWESMLVAIKLGAVVIPSSTLLAPADLADRVARGHARHVIARAEDAPKFAAVRGDYTRIAVGDQPDGWLDYRQASLSPAIFTPDGG
jgi:acetyl-CoA synthetase